MNLRYTALCLAMMALSATSWGQSSVEVIGSDASGTTLKFVLNQYAVDAASDAPIQWQDGHAMLQKGTPDVPVMSKSIIIDHKAATSIEVVPGEFTDYVGVAVPPSKGNLYRNVDPSTVPLAYGPAYETDAFFPGNLATANDPFVYRDFRGQTITFQPFQYNPVTEVLRVYHSMEVRVNHLHGQEGLNAFSPEQRTTAEYDDLYSRHFANYAQYRYDVVDELGGILVITDAQYVETLGPWLEWKTQKGHQTFVTDIAEIGNDIASITAHIAEMYADNDIAFVQLVGDEDQVNTELIVNGGGPGYCDNCYGYIEGDDHMPEVMIARFLVHNDAELVPVIAKSLDYERNPEMSDWASVGIMIGSDEGTGIGDDDQADWQHNNALKEVMLDFTYSDVWEMYDGSHDGDSPTPGDATADGSGSPSSNDISNIINGGAGIVNYTGHGYHDGVSTSGFNGNAVNALTNTTAWPYFIAVACCVGDFDEADGPGDCFGEKWLKATHNGAPSGGIGGSFSSVLQSWAPPMEGQDEMINLIAGVGQQQIRRSLAGVHFHGSMSMVEQYGGGGEEMMDTWCVFGDGSATMRSSMPVNLTVDHDATTFIGVDQLTIGANLDDALISLTVEGEIIGTGVISGGQVDITLYEAITDVVDILVTGTAFNAVPYQGIITVVPLEGPWVTDDAVAIDDTPGNSNNQADYAEDVLLDIDLENVGIEVAYGVAATLTTTDPWVTITDDYHFYGDIDPSNIVSALGEFAIAVVDGVEDQHVAMFVLNVVDTDGTTWTPSFTVTLNAPELDTAEALDVNDGTGNNNGRLDNGETADLFVDNFNLGHSDSQAAIGTLSTSSPWVTINNPTIDLGTLNALGGNAAAAFSVTVDDNAPDGEVVVFDYTVTAGMYTASRSYTEVLNIIIEDWESGDDESFAWEYAGNADWFVQSNTVYEGSYAMESGNIEDNQTTTLELTLDVIAAGEIQFARKVSTEEGWDFLYFFIDGVEQNSWSGELDWEEFTYPVSSGVHTFQWSYVKDFTVSGGSDVCWVDDIVLPPANGSVNVTEQAASNSLSVYPNPTAGTAFLQWNASQSGRAVLEIRNAVGQLVRSDQRIVSSGVNRIDLQTQELPAGLYLVTATLGASQQTVRLIKE